MNVSYKDVRLLPVGQLTYELMVQEMHDDDHEELNSGIQISNANDEDNMQTGDGITPIHRWWKHMEMISMKP